MGGVFSTVRNRRRGRGEAAPPPPAEPAPPAAVEAVFKIIDKNLPTPPAGSSPVDPTSILEHPTLADVVGSTPEKIADALLTDFDPGVLADELISGNMYMTLDPARRAASTGANHYAGGNVTEGSYAGTQLAVTQIYARIENMFSSYFDVLGIEPSLPKLVQLDQKKIMYQFSKYPDPEKPLTYPPHLQTIPEKDNVAQWEIFNALGLVEAGIIVAKVIPDTIVGRTADWLLGRLRSAVDGTPERGVTIADVEEYNRSHRRSATDISRGDNIGHLPDWFADRRFADQAFTGTNPATIERCPKDLLAEFITEARRQGGDAAKWAAVLSNADPAALLVNDSRYFREAVGERDPAAPMHNHEPGSNPTWAVASVALYQLHDDGALHPAAIVVDYKGSVANSVTLFNKRLSPAASSAGEKTDWPWRYAKTAHLTSDWLRHELTVHLCLSHFVEEAIIVAANRSLAQTHPVYRLLYPHWYKTLSLNAGARETLVPQVIKDIVGFTPAQAYSFLRHAYDTYDFVAAYVPNDLKRRGFPSTEEELAQPKYRNYAYARNMLPLWYAIRRYVMAMLLISYGGPDRSSSVADKSIAEDEAVAEWVRECHGGAHMPSFPDIKDLAGLADAVTMCIHVAAPYHSAVNYLQNFYQAFVAARPPGLCAPPPGTLADLQKYTEADLVASLPIGRQRQWLLASQIPWLLSFRVAEDRSLVNYALSQWSVAKRKRAEDDPTAPMVRDVAEGFYRDLQGFGAMFYKHSTDMSPGSIPYMVMSPGFLAVSILI